jgi:hypothetical protein
VISDGYLQIPVGPILAINASEAELAPVLKANFMQPVIQRPESRRTNDVGKKGSHGGHGGHGVVTRNHSVSSFDQNAGEWL